MNRLILYAKITGLSIVTIFFLYLAQEHAIHAKQPGVLKSLTCSGTDKLTFHETIADLNSTSIKIKSIPIGEFNGYALRSRYNNEYIPLSKIGETAGIEKKRVINRFEELFEKNLLSNTLLLESIKKETSTIDGILVSTFQGWFNSATTTSAIVAIPKQTYFDLYIILSLENTEVQEIQAAALAAKTACESSI